ncbi:MAG: hypothetical protein ACERKZ_22140, partial [Lachnotalea sp.]
MKKVIALAIAYTCINLPSAYASTQDIKQEQIKVDSLKELNKVETNQEQIVDKYNQIAYLFGGINIDSSLVYSQKGIILAKEINYLHGLAVSHSYHARALIEAGKLKLSMENFDKALSQFSLEGDSINMLDCYSGISYLASYESSQL